MDKIVDSHCHLDFKDFKDDLENVLQRAKKKNVNYFLTISIDLENFDEIKKIANKYSNIWCSTGIHPNNVPKKIDNDNISKVFDKIKENLKFKKAVGLGETGLDFFRENKNKKNQLIFFENHLYLSGKKKYLQSFIVEMQIKIQWK